MIEPKIGGAGNPEDVVEVVTGRAGWIGGAGVVVPLLLEEIIGGGGVTGAWFARKSEKPAICGLAHATEHARSSSITPVVVEAFIGFTNSIAFEK